MIAADTDTFPFAYGRASFRRHLATVMRLAHRVLVRPGLEIDLDEPEDLITAVRLPAGRWLEPLVPVPPSMQSLLPGPGPVTLLA